MPEKKKVLFIASNIPTPKRKSNGIILTIAHFLSRYFEMQIWYPNEYAPFPLSLLPKYRPFCGIKPWNDDEITIFPFKYIRIPGIFFSFLLLPLYKNKVKRYVEKYGKPNVVHAHFILPDGYIALLMNKLYNIPYIISIRGTDVKYINNLKKRKGGSKILDLMNASLKNADAILVHNLKQKEEVLNFGYSSELISHGINLSNIKIEDADNDTINIVTVGDLIKQKNILWVIKTFREYQGENKIKLHIIGKGPCLEELKSLAGNDSNIVFYGQIPHNEVLNLMSKSQIFAMPSDNETFGLVFLEAAACKMAVIAKKGTGIWGNFTDEEMFFADDFNSFKDMLFRLIDDFDFRNSMAEKARIHVENSYTWEKIINKYLEIYNKLI